MKSKGRVEGVLRQFAKQGAGAHLFQVFQVNNQ